MNYVRSAARKIKNKYFKSFDDYQVEMFINKASYKQNKDAIKYPFLLRNFKNSEIYNVYNLMLDTNLIDRSFALDDYKRELTLCLPNGRVVIENQQTKEIIGTFLSRHNFDGLHHYSAQLDWLTVKTKYRGNHLGLILTAHLVKQSFKSGYNIVFVATNDNRLAAISTYLKLGFLPNLFNSNQIIRWKKIFKNLNIDFDLNYLNEQKIKNNIHSFLTK